MQRHRRSHPAERLSRILRDTLESDSVREAQDRVKTFVTEKPVLSACLGLAAGFVLGMLVRRRD
ncbi:MAG TPA: hypothetical protein VNM14_23425 [Planctomycetota bacterium]|jgi:ElaB/YqjD/DUF883 family membrane-anchored ribosome-binding protein|nr:hypothetical protein [Planctomycetota bacterium]